MSPTWLDELRSVPVIKPKRWSELSGMPRSTVYDAIASGSLPSVHIGQAIWIPTEPLLRLLGADPQPADGADVAADIFELRDAS
ncbi:MAG: hypothetical protein ACLQPH_05915 [Acidimicrobiales bacterium]